MFDPSYPAAKRPRHYDTDWWHSMHSHAQAFLAQHQQHQQHQHQHRHHYPPLAHTHPLARERAGGYPYSQPPMVMNPTYPHPQPQPQPQQEATTAATAAGTGTGRQASEAEALATVFYALPESGFVPMATLGSLLGPKGWQQFRHLGPLRAFLEGHPERFAMYRGPNDESPLVARVGATHVPAQEVSESAVVQMVRAMVPPEGVALSIVGTRLAASGVQVKAVVRPSLQPWLQKYPQYFRLYSSPEYGSMVAPVASMALSSSGSSSTREANTGPRPPNSGGITTNPTNTTNTAAVTTSHLPLTPEEAMAVIAGQLPDPPDGKALSVLGTAIGGWDRLRFQPFGTLKDFLLGNPLHFDVRAASATQHPSAWVVSRGIALQLQDLGPRPPVNGATKRPKRLQSKGESEREE